MAITSCLLAVAALVAAAAPVAAFSGTGSWTDARATYYGRDAWSLHTGSCGFGFICPNRWSSQLAEGWDVTAVSDKSELYGHCGECLEVKCRSANIPDGSGSTLDRKGLCRSSKSVKVKITDTCPCNYPGNAASNKRWCCGDFPHLDLSQWALDKIADDTDRWGVFGIEYRTISCNADITNEASNLKNPAKDPHAGSKPAGLNCATQGLATESTGTKTRATVKKSTHSKKYYARKVAYAEAKKHKHSAKYYKALAAFFAKRGPNMKRLDGKPPGSARKSL